MATDVLIVERDAGVATLTLNRPEQMNALSVELRQALERELTRLRTDPDIKVVILTGQGRAFCAGLDLKEMGSSERENAPRCRIRRAFCDCYRNRSSARSTVTPSPVASRSRCPAMC